MPKWSGAIAHGYGTAIDAGACARGWEQQKADRLVMALRDHRRLRRFASSTPVALRELTPERMQALVSAMPMSSIDPIGAALAPRALVDPVASARTAAMPVEH